ncbi:hypothetical protein [Saccharopolyspora flava]|uniref:Uncharacterized protein n=1 Tax=Saccharopolyspora flava TaxID=95161 RepID=A0A1I6UPW8_9PSEU|nr:hypothetical protein [Saccharopolyspora flava]SFT03491.1 hypothetical protein SAMN05660874_05144 [Saccharopolyspora flava]
MARPVRFITFVDIDDWNIGPGQIAMSARHDMELDDGGLILLLDDRGWAGMATWSSQSPTVIRETARAVVGPDEPFGEWSREDMEAGHWKFVQRRCQEQGADISIAELERLPHEVVLSDRLVALLDENRG